MPWEINGKVWMPKPSAELWRLLEVLKVPGSNNRQEPMAERVAALEKRFLGKIKTNGQCLEHTGSISGNGYRGESIGYKNFRAHRFAYMLYKGDIPKGISVCHSCDNRTCVSLDHLWLGTNGENNKDAWEKGRGKNQHLDKEFCVRGHRLPEEKRWVEYRKAWRRECPECAKIFQMLRIRKPYQRLNLEKGGVE
jgi:hypothetical protein